jgi:large subunit ribosomal protein L24
MRIRRGDNVKIMTGKYKGKTGKVIQAFPDLKKVVVEGVNLMTKHLRTRKENEKGQKVQFAGPIPVANVMVVCPKCSKPTRITVRALSGDAGAAKKVRACKKCKEVIE